MSVDRTVVDQAANLLHGANNLHADDGPACEWCMNQATALNAAGLLVDDQWVHVSCAGYTAPDMFEAFFAGIRWLADRVEVVDGEIDMPSEDQPGVVGMDHGEACGDWLNDYDADTGRVNDDGEYVRPVLVDDQDRAVLDAAEEFAVAYAQSAKRWPHVEDWPRFVRAERALAAAVDARRAANGSER